MQCSGTTDSTFEASWEVSGLINASIIWGNLFPWGCLGLPSTACTQKHWLARKTCHSMISWMFVKCLKKSLRKKMLWQYTCGSPCEMKFISVVCGLAAIQKQPRLVDRAFNRASPSHFPEPAFQALLQTSASPPVSHFWLLPLPPTHPSALSLFPNPVFLTQRAALIYPLLCGLHYLSPPKPWHLFIAFNCSVLVLLYTHAVLGWREFPPWGTRSHTHFPAHAPWSHTPSGTSMNKSSC